MRVAGQEVCYPPLGCFSTAEPWTSPTRPMPAPDSPDSIRTTFFLYTRDRPATFTATTVPETSLKGSDFNPKRPTVFIVHGFLEQAEKRWMEDMKDALLNRADVNVLLTDWARGSFEFLNYLQAASNTRVVGAQIARKCAVHSERSPSLASVYVCVGGGCRLIQQLQSDFGVRPEDVHIIGFSLGGQVAAYAGKAVRGLGKITALDPAQPGFEGYADAVHLTRNDAAFVEVLHTSGRPFVPLGGYGMVAPHGQWLHAHGRVKDSFSRGRHHEPHFTHPSHVDYYINNGAYQPGCILPLTLPKLPQTLEDLVNVPVDVVETVVACDHERAHEVYTQVLQSTSCIFWGHPAGVSAKEVGKPCSDSSCVRLSYGSSRSLRAGSYIVPTTASAPFCSK
ncbi:Phospholipase A1 [Gryllus bimaculatus]|nr:Phospholipase A1 [Gryllus bimaculatus]